ncbi:MAG: hypothetical protein LCH37_01730 [Bacteroidetes bacterium]|nr:hypothetical protein [Bacteroidota bacterium]
MIMHRKTPHYTIYKKLAVQWLLEALGFVSSFVVADNLVLRNLQLLVAAERKSRFDQLVINLKYELTYGKGHENRGTRH